MKNNNKKKELEILLKLYNDLISNDNKKEIKSDINKKIELYLKKRELEDVLSREKEI